MIFNLFELTNNEFKCLPVYQIHQIYDRLKGFNIIFDESVRSTVKLNCVFIYKISIIEVYFIDADDYIKIYEFKL